MAPGVRAGLLAFLLPCLVHAALPPDEVAVIGLSPEEVDCLKGHEVQECFPGLAPQPNPGPSPSPSPSPGGGRPPDEVAATRQWDFHDRLEELRTDFWENRLRASVRVLIPISFRLAVHGLEPHEIQDDPERAYTESQVTVPHKWVRHHLEVRPELNGGVNLGGINKPYGRFVALNGDLTKTFVIEATKLHALDGPAGQDLWGVVGDDAHIAKQAVPLYLRLPLNPGAIGDFLPGEQVSIERFVTINSGIGPNMDILGIPTGNWGALSGGFSLGFGFRDTFVPDYYRTTLTVMRGKKVRVTLQNTRQDNHGWAGGLDIGGHLWFIGARQNVARGSIDTTRSRGGAMEFVFDLTGKYPEAAEALQRAYDGDYQPLRDMMDQGDLLLHGISQPTEATVEERSQGRHASVWPLRWSRDTETSRTEETSDSLGDSGIYEYHHTSRHEASLKRTSWTERESLKMAIRTNLAAKNPLDSRAFTIEYHGTDDKANHDEMVMRLNSASLFADPAELIGIQNRASSLRGLNGHTETSLYLDLDDQAMAKLLAPDPNRTGKFFKAWAQIFGRADASDWEVITDRERERRAANDPFMKRHYGHAVAFVEAIGDGLRKSDPDEQAQAFVDALRGIDFDLYPLAAVARMTDPSMVAWDFHLSNDEDSLHFQADTSYRGANYRLLEPSRKGPGFDEAP